MCLLFLSWAYFQMNDPDAQPWIAAYLTAALASGFVAAGRPAPGLAIGVAAFTTAWALQLLPGAFGQPIGQFFDEVGGELWREFFGLAITASLAGWLGWRTQRLTPEEAGHAHAGAAHRPG